MPHARHFFTASLSTLTGLRFRWSVFWLASIFLAHGGACGAPARHSSESIVDPGEALRGTVREATSRVSARKPRVDRFPREGDLFYECVALPALPSTTLCLFNIRLLMNAALSRVSYYSENEKRVLSDAEMLDEVKGSKAQGFNVPAPTLVDFQARRESGRAFAASHPTSAPILEVAVPDRVLFQAEDAFEADVLVPFARAGADGYLISIVADEEAEGVLLHEIQHAQYFHQPAMRAVVERYWADAFPAADKAAFVAALASAYDTANMRVVIDEFQAYMLMDKPSIAALVPLASRHGAGLRKALEQAGVAPYRDIIQAKGPS